MAVSGKLYAKFFENALGGNNAADVPIDFLSDTIKVALCTSAYTPNQSTHEFFSDVTNEITGTGYTAGGAALTTKTCAASALVTTLDADDTSWTTASFTARYAIVYKSTGTSTTSPLIGYVDFGADQTVSAGTFTITWNASGIVSLTVS
jgi:hypothetical protein